MVSKNDCWILANYSLFPICEASIVNLRGLINYWVYSIYKIFIRTKPRSAYHFTQDIANICNFPIFGYFSFQLLIPNHFPTA